VRWVPLYVLVLVVPPPAVVGLVGMALLVLWTVAAASWRTWRH
jgi:hypothetical protein